MLSFVAGLRAEALSLTFTAELAATDHANATDTSVLELDAELCLISHEHQICLPMHFFWAWEIWELSSSAELRGSKATHQ